MDTGMLWYDGDPKVDLATKIGKASSYYSKKYGQEPNLCFVHPSMLTSRINRTKGVEVRTSKKVLPFHLWLGLQTEKR